MSERQEREPDPQLRQWTPLLLSTGFSLSDLVDFALQIDNTRVAKMAIRNVSTLLAAGCEEERQWRDAIDTLGELLRGHPDITNYSGSTYDGAPTVLALASAQQVAQSALYRLYPSLHNNGEIEGSAFKAFKYLLRAWAQDPKAGATGIEWVERALNLRYRCA
jgi:hypothetical protein